MGRLVGSSPYPVAGSDPLYFILDLLAAVCRRTFDGAGWDLSAPLSCSINRNTHEPPSGNFEEEKVEVKRY